VVSSFNPSALERVKQLEPRLRTGYLADAGSDLRAKLAYVMAGGHDALHPRHDLLDADKASLRVLEAARNAGVEVNVWTVNEPERMRALAALDVDGVMSDDPQRLCATLDAVRTGVA
jgi:glycerophosphoryl diester phosphodiesterase